MLVAVVVIVVVLGHDIGYRWWYVEMREIVLVVCSGEGGDTY